MTITIIAEESLDEFTGILNRLNEGYSLHVADFTQYKSCELWFAGAFCELLHCQTVKSLLENEFIFLSEKKKEVPPHIYIYGISSKGLSFLKEVS